MRSMIAEVMARTEPAGDGKADKDKEKDEANEKSPAKSDAS